jgi:murein DD-endopeptidase MepM/ murein hydrolase activator NlpD
MAKSIPATAPVDGRATHSGRVWQRLSLSPQQFYRRRLARWSELLLLVAVGGVAYPQAHEALGAARRARHDLRTCAHGHLRPGLASDGADRPRRTSRLSVSLGRRLYAHAIALVLTLAAALTTCVPAVPSATTTQQDMRVVAVAVAEDPVVVVSAPDTITQREELAVPYADLSEEEQGVFTEYHLLVEGETLGDVSRRYGITVAALFWSNDLASTALLRAGSELRIPRIAGVPYVIQPGDTLEAIAAQYGVAPEALTLLRENHLNATAPLPIGREIFIPGGVLPYPAELLARVGGETGIAAMRAVVTGAVQENETNLRSGPGRAYERVASLEAGMRLRPVARHDDWVKVEAQSFGSGWVRSDLIVLPDDVLAGLPETSDFPPPPPRWVWPSYGELTSPFGWRSEPVRSFHNGLDIANRAGTPIRAARAGQVFEAGWCSGFGYCVKIDHGGGVVTIYGHMLRKPSVSVGEQVEAGDLIGAMGSTYDRAGGGYVTGVHLHFTVKLNGQAVNPLKYLP